MTASAGDLAAWLGQIWDEEEEAANRLGERVWFVCDDGHVEEPIRQDDPPFGTGEYERWADGEYRLPNHHNTWLPVLDPASVLARIAADRKILAHVVEAARQSPDQGTCDAFEQVLRLKAEAYADRPGYQEAWRPDCDNG